MKIGAVSYLNTKPLIASLSNLLSEGDELLLDLPSRLAFQLANRELDIGLIPVIEFLRGPESLESCRTPVSRGDVSYRIISNAMIGCEGIVRSVRLFFRTEPSQVKTLAIDEGSKTSVALSKILLADLYGVHPETILLPISADPDLVAGDAVLVIGDRAMHPKRFKTFLFDWDLGEKWFQHTGLPFVFAMWVGRSDSDNRLWAERFEEARDEGLARLSDLSRQYASSYQLSHAECMEYLGHNLRFEMTARDLQGLRAFYSRAVHWGLVPKDLLPVWPRLPETPSLGLVSPFMNHSCETSN